MKRAPFLYFRPSTTSLCTRCCIVTLGLMLAAGNLSRANAEEKSGLRTSGELLFQDDFNRQEEDDSKEQVGNNWGTNSKSRAAGNKQVDLKDGALHIKRHEVADHGVSVVQDVKFRDCVIELRFQLGKTDDLGINIADMQEKSVHAGHLCVARIRLNRVEITDLKTGRMNLQVRESRKSGSPSEAVQELVKKKSKFFDVDLSENEWHDLRVQIKGDTMSVAIDGESVGAFQSPGVAHPTKRRLRLAVGKSAVVDDINIWGTP
ncbi:MAG: family 16 glycoside hydrolase [Rubripirellula sp.]